jgi:hypothetical protein
MGEQCDGLCGCTDMKYCIEFTIKMFFNIKKKDIQAEASVNNEDNANMHNPNMSNMHGHCREGHEVTNCCISVKLIVWHYGVWPRNNFRLRRIK